MYKDKFNIDAIIAEFGAVYENNGQTDRDIKRQLFAQDDISQYFRRIPWTDEIYRSAYGSVDEVLQAFSIPFTSKATLTFKPWSQRLGEFKIDHGVTPDALRQSWMGFLVNLPEPERTKWPIMRWIIQEYLLNKAQEDFVKQVAYYGWKITEYDAAQTITASGAFPRQFSADNIAQPADGSMDGVRLQIAKMIDAGRVTPIAIPGGTWSTTPADFYDQIDTMIKDGVSDELRDELDVLFMNQTLYRRFREGKRAKFNQNYMQEEDLVTIEDTDIRVAYTRSQNGSDQVWATPPRNRVMPVRTDMSNRFDLQKNGRSVEILGDWSKLLTFDVPEFIVTSDIGSTISGAEITARYAE